MTEIYLIYAGMTDGGSHKYYRLEDIDKNEPENSALDLKSHTYKNNNIGKYIGAIYKVKEEGDSVSFKSKTPPVGWWRNRRDILIFQTIDKAARTEQEQKKASNKNELEAVLQPIKVAYNSTYNGRTRAAIIAEVIRIITGR